MYFQVLGEPHPWPRDGKTPSTACAIIIENGVFGTVASAQAFINAFPHIEQPSAS